MKYQLWKIPRQILSIVLGAFIATTIFVLLPACGWAQPKPELLFYYGNGCPHCAAVEKYFNEHNIDQRFTVLKKEVYQNTTNAQELAELFEKYNVPEDQQGVPFMLLNGHYYVGDTPIIEAIELMIASTNINTNKAPSPEPINAVADRPKLNTNANTNTAPTAVPTTPEKHLNFFVVTGAALVDAISPCEFAVLIILMATVLATSHRRRALISGLLFSLAVYISYLAMGLGLYSAIAAVGFTWWIQRVAGGLAIILGLFNLKDAIWYGKGFLLEVPLSWRPRMKGFLQSVTNPFAALLIGFVVSLFLLPCTSGPYIVIVGMLGKESTFSQAVWWLIYYNLIFILPMLTITFAVYFGLKPESLESIRQKRLRLLHAIAGCLLLALGIYLII